MIKNVIKWPKKAKNVFFDDFRGVISFRDSPLAASRCKRAAELARLRTNHPEGGPFRSDRAIHRSIYLYVNMWGSPRGGPTRMFSDCPVTKTQC